MNKIDFKNKGEVGAIPINADNLKLLQKNTEDAINEVVERGSNIIGEWIKFNDGSLITCQEQEITISCNETWGNLFVGNYDETIEFPQTFLETPKVIVDLKIDTGACFKLEWEKPVITTSSYKNIGICRGSSSNSVKFKATLLSIGKWK